MLLVRPMHVSSHGEEVHCPVLSLVDRRSTRPRSKEFVFCKAVETILFGPNQVRSVFLAAQQKPLTASCEKQRSRSPPRCSCPRATQRTTGAFHSILQKNSFDDAVLVVEKRSVEEGTLLQEERRIILSTFAPLVPDVEARNRVKRCSLVPVSVVVAAAGAHGRCAETVSLLTALHQLPRAWKLAVEQEANHARLEHDLLIEEELQEMEEEGVHLAAELSVMAPFADDREDDTAASNWRLPSIPASLNKELDAYAKYRAEPLNRFRDGSAVVDVTVGNDRASALRFLGWLRAEKEVLPGLGAFGKGEVAGWVEEWLHALKAKGVKYSSLSNYVNSLIAVTGHVYSTYKIDESIYSMQRTPLDELIRLRGQCESEAKQQRLYQRRDANWIEWPAANEARKKAEAAFRAKATPQTRRDWLLISLHTCAPPDRVGVVRKLRLGHSLKRCGGGFVLDLTTQRSHKTSKFCEGSAPFESRAGLGLPPTCALSHLRSVCACGRWAFADHPLSPSHGSPQRVAVAPSV